MKGFVTLSSCAADGTEIVDVADELQEWFENEWVEAGLAGPGDQEALKQRAAAERAAQHKRRAEEQAADAVAAAQAEAEDLEDAPSPIAGMSWKVFYCCCPSHGCSS